MIILNFEININNYVKNFFEIVEQILNKLKEGKIVCPKCEGFLRFNCAYRRNSKDANGESIKLKIIQVKCQCGKTHALIPDFLMPYKHYDTKTIEAAVSSNINDSDCAADNSTIYRWRRQFEARGAYALGILLAMLWELYEIAVSSLKLNDLPLLKRLSICIKELIANKSPTIIGCTNVLLTHANAGYI